jgi:hypothetical protein
LFQALTHGIKEEHMPYNLQSYKDTNDTNFYTLTTNEIFGEWTDNVDAEVARRKAASDNPQQWESYEFEHDERLKISKQQQHGALYGMQVKLFCYVFEVLHFKLRLGIGCIFAFVMIIWCIFSWSLKDIVTILAATCMCEYTHYPLCF